MATAEKLQFNKPHPPQQNAVEAFTNTLQVIKKEIIKSRHDWNKHEPRMWNRAGDISDDDLTSFTIENDLISVRSASTSYGTIILGKIRLPKVDDGYVHVRIHDPPNRGTDDITFHSLFTEEVRPVLENPPTDYRAIHTKDKLLEFFNE